ncbi:MAG: PIN domain-containing protein [Gemmatimonadetes bacterium]|nr:PIN domain-containing protein [Gemmatimonadota bacterium]
MRLLLDVNIVLDVALEREPWFGEAAVLLSEIERGHATGFIAAHTVTTYHYIVGKQARSKAVEATADLLRIMEVVPAEKADFLEALALNLPDFEDAVQAVAALKVGADYLVTRNADDFRGAAIPLRTAGEILAILGQPGTSA